MWLFKCEIKGFPKYAFYFGKYSLSAWEECLLWLIESTSHTCQLGWQCCSGLFIDFLFDLSVIEREKLKNPDHNIGFVSFIFVFHFVRVYPMHFDVLLICAHVWRCYISLDVWSFCYYVTVSFKPWLLSDVEVLVPQVAQKVRRVLKWRMHWGIRRWSTALTVRSVLDLHVLRRM